ncbi:MAG TPA: NmrA family NAD(P)-binding protein [Gemmatimonadaceae bacterium]|nr:NmrA family NAD(P)-binding protein [Gemmatimonadaceae bacterium]
MTPAPRDDAELEERLSRPTAAVTDALRQTSGDIVILGAGGKMGPSLTAMVKRALDGARDSRNVIAVSRFSSQDAAAQLESAGVRVVRADLNDRDSLSRLPDAPNVIYMAGQKFGTGDLPSLTWAVNTLVPAMVAERYASSRIVAFSTGNVYALSPATSAGSREGDALTPVGEYANSCVGRERVLEHASRTRGTPVSIIRLNYAVDLRYGVLVDIAQRIAARERVRVDMGYVNVIWQGDANAQAIRALPLAASPPFVVNVTGPERLSVRAVAERLGALLGIPPEVEGIEAPDALLSDTSLAQTVFGPPSVSTDTLIAWVADWVARGGTRLGKATKFEVRDGKY